LDASDQQQFVAAVWFEHRYYSRKAKFIDGARVNWVGALGDLDDLVRVKFRSTPTGAEVFVDGIRRGATPVHLFLSSKAAYDVRMSKNGFNTWEKQKYTPKNGDSFDEKL
jgi:hypothetical protein